MNFPSTEPILSIVTASSYDSSRLEFTLRSMSHLSNLDVEHITVLPNSDTESIAIWNGICGQFPNFKLMHDDQLGIYSAMNVGGRGASGVF